MKEHNANDLDLSVDTQVLKPLFKTNIYRHAGAILLDWALIIAVIYLCHQYLNPLTYILAIIIIGGRMHGLTILMHDATHYRFLKNRKWNDLITNLVTMYPLFTSIEGYRKNHMAHHRHLNTDHDPDWVAKLGKKTFTFPKSKREFLMTVFSYFSLYQGISDALWFLRRFGSTKSDSNGKQGIQKVRLLFYIGLVVGLTVGGLWIDFIAFWVIPYLSTFFMFQYIRSVAEHFGELAYDHLLTSTRSVKPTLLEQFFIAPHQVGYHIEHHLYPGVPFYNLPKLHQALMQDSIYSDKAHITQGYIKGLLNELGQVDVVKQEELSPS